MWGTGTQHSDHKNEKSSSDIINNYLRGTASIDATPPRSPPAPPLTPPPPPPPAPVPLPPARLSPSKGHGSWIGAASSGECAPAEGNSAGACTHGVASRPGRRARFEVGSQRRRSLGVRGSRVVERGRLGELEPGAHHARRLPRHRQHLRQARSQSLGEVPRGIGRIRSGETRKVS